MARGWHSGHVQRVGPNAVRLPPYMGRLLDSVRKHERVLVRCLWKLVDCSMLFILDRRRVLDHFDQPDLGYQNPLDVSKQQIRQ